MNTIDKYDVQMKINHFVNRDVYLHLETTNGAYTGYRDQSNLSVGAYIRNGKVKIVHGKITGNGPYRVGLKIDLGWIYAEGLTDWEMDKKGRLLLAGHNHDGKLAVALQLSDTPFSY